MLELMAGNVAGPDGLEFDRQLGLFNFKDGFGVFVVITLRLVFGWRISKNASGSALLRGFPPLDVIALFFAVAGRSGRDTNLVHSRSFCAPIFSPFARQNKRTYAAKTRDKLANTLLISIVH